MTHPALQAEPLTEVDLHPKGTSCGARLMASRLAEIVGQFKTQLQHYHIE